MAILKRAVRLWDQCTGHGCFPPRPNDQASPNVFINSPGDMGRGSHRLTDHWMSHCCVSCHDSNACEGSPNTFVNNLPKCRVGDAVCCGSRMAQGATNVFVNEPTR